MKIEASLIQLPKRNLPVRFSRTQLDVRLPLILMCVVHHTIPPKMRVDSTYSIDGEIKKYEI